MQTMPSPTEWSTPMGPPPTEERQEEPAEQPTPIGLTGEIIAIFAAVAGAILSLFLPWITAMAPFVGRLSINGLDTGDGKIIGAGLLILAALAFAEHKAPRRGAVVILALGFVAMGMVVLMDYQDVARRVADANTLDIGMASIGAGLYLCGVSAAVGAVASWIRFWATKK